MKSIRLIPSGVCVCTLSKRDACLLYRKSKLKPSECSQAILLPNGYYREIYATMDFVGTVKYNIIIDVLNVKHNLKKCADGSYLCSGNFLG
jgi:hypothetical protein